MMVRYFAKKKREIYTLKEDQKRKLIPMEMDYLQRSA